MGGGRLLAAQLLFDGGICQAEQVSNLLLELLRLADQVCLQFDLEVDAGSLRAVVVVADFATDSDVEVHGHGYSCSWV